ncbi:MarR family transcriptional regulator [Trueperella sp. LYQ143]|uniref:MarR family transcriptional regulator n=1 Tax=unclassified Trueperella TaxID=2630174 RepID=UPI0039838C90
MRRTCMGHVLAQAKQLADRRFARILNQHGIDAFNGAQGRILYVLWHNDGQSLREIGQATGLAAATLTSMVDRMEKAGLVSRVQSSKDRRTTLIRLSGEAQKLEEAYYAVSDEMAEAFFAGFSAEERRMCEELLTRAVENLKRLEYSE